MRVWGVRGVSGMCERVWAGIGLGRFGITNVMTCICIGLVLRVKSGQSGFGAHGPLEFYCNRSNVRRFALQSLFSGIYTFLCRSGHGNAGLN